MITEIKNIANRSLEMSSSMKAFKSAEKFLNLGASKDILMSELTPEERDQSYKILAKLLKEGIIGYRYYIVDGKLEKHFIENELVDRRLANAKPVKIKLPEGGVLV